MQNFASAYASARIDGVLDLASVRVGIMRADQQQSPVAKFRVIAGLQAHPVWALNRLAIVVYSYCQVAKAMDGGTLEVSVSGNLVSDHDTVCIVAASIIWHTSSQIRQEAEQIIGQILGPNGAWASNCRWPFEAQPLRMPVQRD